MVFKRGSTESLGGRAGGVSLGMWERVKGLASLPCPPLQWFLSISHCRLSHGTWEQQQTNKKNQNGNSWLEQPRRAWRLASKRALRGAAPGR